MIRILPLFEVPEHSELITDWLFQAFGSENSRDFFASIVNSSLRPEGLPVTFVALLDDKPVGTVGLWRCDLISRQDLYPWLAALYIDESQRGCGLGAQLQHHVEAFSRRTGFRELYLYATFANYYERFGWQYIGDGLDYPDQPVRLYRKDI
ncbi:GNAT family acetyltransferase [Hafnia paralvei ATCC 29927]|jgi:predicted N-acetyltransferase YhbS|uniref:N-acetyltransferase n=1 Tax=Hafnia paralvei TaxID=546367 RepID=A0A2A2MGM4_9GAMM|nr:GNAT family N-acetyltransferase [Hafnia paralvei]MDU1191413.1 GNAT family N-acetyltransferase [Enterobacteriaceae bacterium]AMH19939.1 N-acetyltransferase [Hafnia paralvei]KHS46265.1 GNAT family acetyltransferase [Hafnia paralvei]MBU2671850.1 GNAT family N-acetyltransferase [Hafnia paralvei]MBW2957438.1 GNAT family N-acetyltransferase [Hafnia paralvei]